MVAALMGFVDEEPIDHLVAGVAADRRHDVDSAARGVSRQLCGVSGGIGQHHLRVLETL